MAQSIFTKYIDEVYNQADIILEPAEERKMKQTLEESLIEEVGEKTIDMLNENDRAIYLSMIDKNYDNNALMSFINNHIPDYNNKITQVIIDFCSEFLIKVKKSIILNSVDTNKYSSSEDDNKTIEDKLSEESDDTKYN